MKVLVVAGETSGDAHAARVVRHLHELHPGIRIDAMGGDAMARAGAHLLHHHRDYAFLGLWEVLRHLSRFRALEADLRGYLESERPDVFVPVDYPGLNLRLARHAHGLGIRVLYFIGPQVWAWGARRLRRMRDLVDRVSLILPFEPQLYREAGVPAEYVGHPLLEEMDSRSGPAPPREGNLIALLPGSRVQEVERLLPLQLEAARRLRRDFPDLRFEVGAAPLLDLSVVSDHLALHPDLDVSIAAGTADLLARARVAVVASGTATLESALRGTPMVVVYRTSWPTFLAGRLLVRIPWIGLVNIVAGEPLAPELVQGRARPAGVHREVARLLRDETEWDRRSRHLAALRERLSGGGGTRRVAESILEIAPGPSPRAAEGV
jgi:lipid-A-disaccharide synthase